MSLAHEATITRPGWACGDIKIAHYAINLDPASNGTAHQLIEPTNDPGFFVLNGAVVSQTTYPNLYTLFGTTYNTGGEGAGNFRLPDLSEGRVPITKGLTNFTSLGASGGEISHILTSAEMPSHSHGYNMVFASGSHSHSASGTIDAGGSHSHSLTAVISAGGTRTAKGNSTSNASESTGSGTTAGASAGHFHALSLSIGNGQSALTVNGGVSNSSPAGGGAHNNMQPYVVMGAWLVRYL